MFQLLAPGRCSYDDWRAVHMPMLVGLLPELERAAAQWEAYERLCKTARKNRLPDPPEPSPSLALLLWLLLHAPAYAQDRAGRVAELQDRRHPLPDTFTLEEFVKVLTGEALAAGVGCDYDTPYQVWMVLAELLLRDVDIGEIIARVHPDRAGYRSPRLSAAEIDSLNARLASAQRKRVNVKRKAFGYRTA